MGDKVSLRAGVADSSLYLGAGERMKELTVPSWMSVDLQKREVEIKGIPAYVPNENLFDLGAVMEFYNR